MHQFLKFIFGIKLHVSDSSSVHHQEFFTVHTQQWYICHTGLLTACEQDQDVMLLLLLPSWSCLQADSKPVWCTPLVCLQWKIPDDGQRNCMKHVEFYSKNKFEKLVHLVGFIIRINAPCLYIKNWSEYGSLETKHVANYVLMIIYIYVVFYWLNKLFYHVT